MGGILMAKTVRRIIHGFYPEKCGNSVYAGIPTGKCGNSVSGGIPSGKYGKTLPAQGSQLVRKKLVENDAVGFIHLDFFGTHDQGLFLNINREECHGVRFVIEADQMFVIREEGGILGILAADRQAEYLFQMPVIGIYAEDHDGIVSRIGADEVFEIRGKIQRARCRTGCMIVIEGGNRLYLFKIGAVFRVKVEIYIDQVFELMDDIKEMTVAGEFEMPGG